MAPVELTKVTFTFEDGSNKTLGITIKDYMNKSFNYFLA
jgi:hypothetical protein